MTQDTSTYYVWIGGSCDYGHKERAGGAAVVIENNGSIISRDVISDLHTTEFRMMLTLMIKVMQEIQEGSDILFLTNAAYIQNFDKAPTSKSANPDLIVQCIEEKKRHKSVGVKIVQYHKSPLLIETHDRATEAMAKTRKEFHQKKMKNMEYKDKVVIVTGGAQGIGKCIAEEFRKQGALVEVIDKQEGLNHFVGDLSNRYAIEEFTKLVIEKYGKVDFIVNNALPLMIYHGDCGWKLE